MDARQGWGIRTGWTALWRSLAKRLGEKGVCLPRYLARWHMLPLVGMLLRTLQKLAETEDTGGGPCRTVVPEKAGAGLQAPGWGGDQCLRKGHVLPQWEPTGEMDTALEIRWQEGQSSGSFPGWRRPGSTCLKSTEHSAC